MKRLYGAALAAHQRKVHGKAPGRAHVASCGHHSTHRLPGGVKWCGTCGAVWSRHFARHVRRDSLGWHHPSRR